MAESAALQPTLESAGVTLLNTFNSVVVSTVDAVKTTGQFAAEQLPDLIQQLITWKIAEASLTVLITSIIMFFVFRKFFGDLKQLPSIMTAYENRHLSNETRRGNTLFDRDGDCHQGVLFYLFALIPFMILSCNLYELLQLIIAPKIWLIEYGADLVKGHQCSK